MATAWVERRLVAILAADVVGYSHLVEMDEAGTLAALKALRREVIDPLLAEHHGRIVKLMGDGALAEFGSVVDAVACAVAVQKGVAEQQADVPTERRIVFRIGVNLGDVVVEGDDLLGDGVNIAARLEQICEPGGVMISGTAYDHLQGKLGLPMEFAGEQRLKNIDRPIRAYRIDPGGLPPAVKAPRLRRGLFWPLALAALLILGLGTGTWLWRGTDNPVPAQQRPAIAVLPFVTFAADEASNRLANGLTDDIITDLSRQTGIDVIARASTEVYKGRPTDVRQIGRDLAVRFVLDGSIQREADQIRATARLSDTATGAQVWSNRWDRPARDVFAVQTEIAEQVIGQFEMLTGPVKAPGLTAAKRKRPESLTAYELTLLGVEKQLSPTREGIAESIQILNKAIAVDPNYAQAWVELAWAHDSAKTFGADAETYGPSGVASRETGGRVGSECCRCARRAGPRPRDEGGVRPSQIRVRDSPAPQSELVLDPGLLCPLGQHLRRGRAWGPPGRPGDSAEPQLQAVGGRVPTLGLLHGRAIQGCPPSDGTADAGQLQQARLGAAGGELRGARPTGGGAGDARRDAEAVS